MRMMSMEEQVRMLARPAHDRNGHPTMGREEVVEIVRGHLELHELDYYTDDEIWRRWLAELATVAPDAINATVFDRVVVPIRAGR
jgi:hypothetical protein